MPMRAGSTGSVFRLLSATAFIAQLVKADAGPQVTHGICFSLSSGCLTPATTYLAQASPTGAKARTSTPLPLSSIRGSHRSAEGCLTRRQKVLQMQEACTNPKDGLHKHLRKFPRELPHVGNPQQAQEIPCTENSWKQGEAAHVLLPAPPYAPADGRLQRQRGAGRPLGLLQHGRLHSRGIPARGSSRSSRQASRLTAAQQDSHSPAFTILQKRTPPNPRAQVGQPAPQAPGTTELREGSQQSQGAPSTSPSPQRGSRRAGRLAAAQNEPYLHSHFLCSVNDIST